MQEKRWKTYDMTVNGLAQQARFNEETVEGLFVPFLKTLAALHAETERRIVAYLAAPPAAGKTTLAQFLERLARERRIAEGLRAVGLDGFHYPAEYLATHFLPGEGGAKVPLQSVKGAPETYDVELLQEKIRAARRGEVAWPRYDRRIHDTVPDAEPVDADILLLEGNWLLLKDSEWTGVRAFADYSVLVRADPALLRERLVSRKVQGGMQRADAEAFYESSDRRNVERVLSHSAEPDEAWRMEADGDYMKFPCPEQKRMEP